MIESKKRGLARLAEVIVGPSLEDCWSHNAMKEGVLNIGILLRQCLVEAGCNFVLFSKGKIQFQTCERGAPW